MRNKSILDMIKSNQKSIEDIEDDGHCILEDSLIIYNMGNGYYKLCSIFDIKNMCMVVQNCSLDFILGDPLGFLSVKDGAYQKIKATSFYEHEQCGEDILLFKRYEDNHAIVFDAIDEYDEEDNHEITMELSDTHRFSTGDVLLIEADYSLHYRLVGNDKYIHCETCGRLKPKDGIKTLRGKKVCREKCTGRWIDKTTR